MDHQSHGHFGPMPVLHDLDEEKPIIVPSQAMETAARAGCLRRFVVLVVLASVVGATFWTIRYHQRSLAAAAAAAVVPAEAPKLPILSNASDASSGDAEVVEAREFLLQKILPAQTWQDLVPHVRLPETTEPMMREYHATRPFKPLAGLGPGGAKTVENSAGRFAVFLLSSKDFPVAMIEVGTDGPKLDWEMLVNHPLVEWERFLKARPAATGELAVTITRCYIREDYLTAEEKTKLGQLIGVRLGMPGNEVQLFAAVSLESETGRWVSENVPWEHENKTTLARMVLAFDPKHRAFDKRVTIHGQPGFGWNRRKPGPLPPPEDMDP